tara:strand:+ start:595 stop:789 length:195 start_codon:yes stop_codon:yes gene_type:complete
MTYKERITASFNKALANKLRKESRQVSKKQTEAQAINANNVKRRRYAEDAALAKELGVNIEELK